MPLQRWQGAYGLTGFPLSEPDFVETLQIQPEFRRCTEEMRETQSRIPGNSSLSIQNCSDAVGWYVQLPSETGSADSKFSELFSKVLTGMDRRNSHGHLLSDNPRLRRRTALKRRPPRKADSPLIVDGCCIGLCGVPEALPVDCPAAQPNPATQQPPPGDPALASATAR